MGNKVDYKEYKKKDVDVIKKDLYLMRHGQTRFNALGKIQGACDSPLTEEGIAQAHKAREYFEKENLTFPDAYCSTQERASDTLEIVIGEDKPYTRLKGIKEWDFGVFEGERDILQPRIKAGVPSHMDFYVEFGGESHLEMSQRINDTLTKVMEESPEEKVLAVAHGGVLHMFLQQWMPTEEVFKMEVTNCVIMHLTYEDGKFSFVERIDPLSV